MEYDLNPVNIFDFDGTLTTETWPKFWTWVEKFGYSGEKRNEKLEEAIAKYRSTHSGNALETFFGFFNDLLISNNDTITYDELMIGEKYIIYNPGVEHFIKESNSKNYIVSGGLKEFLARLSLAPYFSGIYGTPVQTNEQGLISGIGEIMTDDKKLLAIQEILRKNNRRDNDCRNVYYIGDGYSDAVAMRFIHNHGGKTIFVHQPTTDDDFYEYINRIYNTLNSDGIVDFSCIADYRDGSELSNILQRNYKKRNKI